MHVLRTDISGVFTFHEVLYGDRSIMMVIRIMCADTADVVEFAFEYGCQKVFHIVQWQLLRYGCLVSK